MEIFTTMEQTVENRGYMTGTFSGIPAGILKATVRTITGVYDIVTFPFPSYKPILEPEFVIETPFRKMREE